jgi:hypothetical protein
LELSQDWAHNLHSPCAACRFCQGADPSGRILLGLFLLGRMTPFYIITLLSGLCSELNHLEFSLVFLVVGLVLQDFCQFYLLHLQCFRLHHYTFFSWSACSILHSSISTNFLSRALTCKVNDLYSFLNISHLRILAMMFEDLVFHINGIVVYSCHHVCLCQPSKHPWIASEKSCFWMP